MAQEQAAAVKAGEAAAAGAEDQQVSLDVLETDSDEVKALKQAATKANGERDQAQNDARSATGRLQAEGTELRGMLAEFRRDKLDRTERETREARASEVPANQRHLTAEERETQAAELDTYSRSVQGPLEDLEARVMSRVEQRISSVETSQASAGNAAFMKKVDALVPGIDALDAAGDPGWMGFMNGVDPLSGQPRLALAQKAMKNGDVSRVVLFAQEHFKAAGITPDDDRAAQLAAQETVQGVAGQSSRTAVPEGERIPLSAANKFLEEYGNERFNGESMKDPAVRAAADTRYREISQADAEGRLIEG